MLKEEEEDELLDFKKHTIFIDVLKKCNLAAASHAPRRLAGMKIRKIILSYCAQ